MTREIKFRLVDTKHNSYEMVSGEKAVYEPVDLVHAATGQFVARFGSKENVQNFDHMDIDYDETFENFKLLQYTGLKDKKGVEMYEGDIVQLEYGSNYFRQKFGIDLEKAQIKFGNYSSHGDDYYSIPIPAGFYLEKEDKSEGIIYNDECIVIGNIYENPELLVDDKQ